MDPPAKVDEKAVGEDKTDTIVTQREHKKEDDCSDLTDNHPGEEHSPKSFPQKLMDILSNEEYESIISWLPHGNGFIIHKKKTFASDVLPKHFKASKFTSFTRKLNRWGFQRVPRGPETGAYYHKLFKRGNPELCMQMTSNSGNKYQGNPMQQQLMPSGMGMPMMPFPFVDMANMTQQQQQALWQQQMHMMQIQHMQMMQAQMQQQQQQSMGMDGKKSDENEGEQDQKNPPVDLEQSKDDVVAQSSDVAV